MEALMNPNFVVSVFQCPQKQKGPFYPKSMYLTSNANAHGSASESSWKCFRPIRKRSRIIMEALMATMYRS
jgi:hypothetical protein